jgi:HPr kinase/phosphorylase
MILLPTHGVLIQWNNIGVYLLGESCTGKSEAALHLIYQGAKLVCDDAPEFVFEKKTGELIGVCPSQIYGLMHIRDLGIINLLELLGKLHVEKRQRIDFVIQLIKTQKDHKIKCHINPQYHLWYFTEKQTFQKQGRFRMIQGLQIHLYPGRNIPMIIKTAILQFSRSRQEHLS